MTPRRLAWRASALAAIAVMSASCGGDPEGGDDRRGESPTSGAQPSWVAVIEVAPRADDLDDLTRQVSDALGTALVVSPVGCFEGLPPEAGEGYLIGAVAASAGEAERLVEDAGEQVAFSASVTIVCTD